jgi:hypothetical protein
MKVGKSTFGVEIDDSITVVLVRAQIAGIQGRSTELR